MELIGHLIDLGELVVNSFIDFWDPLSGLLDVDMIGHIHGNVLQDAMPCFKTTIGVNVMMHNV